MSLTTELRDPSSDSDSEFNCDNCSLTGASSDSEKTSAEFYSEELDIASSRVQECWQVSAAHIVPLGFVLVCSCRHAVNRVEILLAQVCYLRYAWGYW